MCSHCRRGDHLDGFEGGIANVLKQPLPGPEHDRDDVEIELVEQPGRQVLLHNACAAGNRDVVVIRRRPGSLEGGLDPVGDERERRPTLHRQRLARVVAEYEHRRVEGRVLAPPARPRLVPRSVAAAEHLAAHDVGADTLDDLVDDLRVGAALAALQSVLLAPAGGREHPLVQAHPALSDRVLEALVGPGDEAVERHRDVAGD